MPTASRAIRTRTGTGADGRTRRLHRTKLLIFAGATALCALIVACVVAFAGLDGGPAQTPTPAGTSPQSMAVVVTIDGQGVPVRELELFLADERANTFAYFQQRYADSDHPGFWTTAYGGQTPQDHLKKLAIADAVRDTVQQNLARKYALVADTGYAAFLDALKAENARRALALTQHQPIYGPVQYTEANYFTYDLSQITADLQTTLVNRGAIAVTDKALRQYYTAHQSNYEQPSSVQGTVIGPQASPSAAPFDQVKTQVEQDYTQDSYDALITRLAAAASVRVDTGVLASVAIS